MSSAFHQFCSLFGDLLTHQEDLCWFSSQRAVVFSTHRGDREVVLTLKLSELLLEVPRGAPWRHGTLWLQPSPIRRPLCCILSRRPQFVPFLISRTGSLSYLSQCQEAFLKIQLLPLPLSVFQELSWGPINCIPFQMHCQHLKNKMSASKFISAFSSTL